VKDVCSGDLEISKSVRLNSTTKTKAFKPNRPKKCTRSRSKTSSANLGEQFRGPCNSFAEVSLDRQTFLSFNFIRIDQTTNKSRALSCSLYL